MEPLVSVIIPMYNREKTICRAIDSVLNQTYRNIEIIVVDDGSTDGSLQLAQDYIKKGVKVIASIQNVGVAAARNVGMKAATGEYIAFQDSDDEWFPNKLQVQIDHMNGCGTKVSFCPYVLVLDDNLTQIYPSMNKIQMIASGGVHVILNKENVVGTPTIVMHREVMEQVGLFDESFSSFEDYDYFIRISQKYDIGFIEQPLVRVYRTKISLTTNKEVYIKGREMLIAKHGDYLDVESRIKGIMLFNTLDYDTGFLENLEWIRESYSQGDVAKEKYINDVILKALGKEYIQMKRVQKFNRDTKLMQLQGEEFAIYGAGNIGRKIYYELKQRKLIPQFFIVSHYQDNTERFIDNIPVREICEVSDRNIEIIVAVALETQEEILNNLSKLRFNNYFIVDQI